MKLLLLLITLLFSFTCFSFSMNEYKNKSKSQIQAKLSKYSNKELASALEGFSKVEKTHKLYNLVGSSLYYRTVENLVESWDEKLAKAAISGLQFPLTGGDGLIFISELNYLDEKYQDKFRKLVRSTLSKKNQKDFFQELELIKKTNNEGNG